MRFEALVDAIPPIGPSTQAPHVHADKAYDILRCRELLHRRRIAVRIARGGIESSERLGRHRWVVERSFAWLNRYRRLPIRYEWRGDIHQAFSTLGCCLICLNAITRL